MKRSVIKATNEGKLYKETKDFFSQPKIIMQIKKLRNSRIVKEIEDKKKKIWV